MSKIIDYDIVTSAIITNLIETVEEAIKSGWQPQGGIAATAHYDTATGNAYYEYAQALVKYAPEAQGQ
jgi:hypothetical protein